MKKYLAECVGTFVLVFGGVGSAVLAGHKIGNVGVALSFGLALLAMVYAIGPISGCHVNPAVTLGLFVAKKLRGADVLGYWIAQCLGAIVAAGVLLLIANGAPHGYDASVSELTASARTRRPATAFSPPFSAKSYLRRFSSSLSSVAQTFWLRLVSQDYRSASCLQ